ncbi:hypothetical protein CANARDRAFT_26257 [[Candida] arabinofermentans NRRL YB-2248]|uniref:DNA polymerase epsilon subunit D n=1 Tax=[Candida] arabinofermentans NRRL YB-2248 TaxID=983967 RepID=A0A1E4T8N1_9ASCO|nr:hypothetical protein CANARDRAFT_26257 [[Candida] arabinofermentans NRRL YB-2248]
MTGPESQMIITKDAQTVVQRSSVLFVNYIYYHAKQVSKLQGRKIVNASDILAGLENAGFLSYLGVLQEELEGFNKRKEAKKREKASNTSKEITDNNKTDRGSSTEDPEEEDDEDVEDTGDVSKRVKLSEDAKSKDVNVIDAEQRDDDDVDEGEEEDDDEEMVDAQEGINDDDDDDDDDDDEADDDVQELTPTQRLQKEHKELIGSDGEEKADNTNVDDDEEDDEDDD